MKGTRLLPGCVIVFVAVGVVASAVVRDLDLGEHVHEALQERGVERKANGRRGLIAAAAIAVAVA
jgi:hypothetical protein